MDSLNLMEVDTPTAGEPRSERVSTHRVGASMTSLTKQAASGPERIDGRSVSSAFIVSGFRTFKRAPPKPPQPSFDSPAGVTPKAGAASGSAGSAAAFSFARTFKRPKKSYNDEMSSAPQPEGTLVPRGAGQSTVPDNVCGTICPCDGVGCCLLYTSDAADE